MNTKYALHARFGTPLLALSDVCEEFFHINEDTAKGKANSHSLPIPVFRMDDNKRSPFMVHVDDLADLIDLRRQSALKEFVSKTPMQADERETTRLRLLDLLSTPTQEAPL
ncbi:hypothetical protein A1QO_15600 [Vibrio genomosp. F10 str. ZF-129]|uniref:Pyocin activator protein PrtN n=1 Tax=Vibrio genomosp. F10 str. ZF-129 TaxID=1187848 RepID=A0A1E5BA09_9VIBR|nr:pyocin activator PrtN family protein [Vibrio genomosp. F10]OEE30755.1 hypothetical protein A1QO_15600 [Vibrio genomosp. F10 str. ZF-129]